ncbi:phosphoenolpyruvate-utilizing N-terminal domain-containing protein, partial [Staphylococcus auricularis]|uniref:phosphoenolpyruvate-utilizing N-terminal domain-containing protein n=1 Tax=Staphylococcus auricularis TaxID=29379 RepID=UPI0029816BBB
MEKLRNGMERTKVELSKIGNNGEENLGGDKGGIFDGHLVILDDGEIINGVEDKMKKDKVNGGRGLSEVSDELVCIFECMENEYMKEPPAHIRHLSKPVFPHILPLQLPNPTIIHQTLLIIPNHLTPSHT